MIALDTNVLIRLLVDDDASQSAVARALVEQAVVESAPLFVSDVVLCELAWVLQRGYRVPRSAVADAIGGLLAAEQMAIPGRDEALVAVDAFRRGRADFADYLIRERACSSGAAAVVTFDGAALADAGFVHPDPARWPGDVTLRERPPRYGGRRRVRVGV